jgi:hypothetical protein
MTGAGTDVELTWVVEVVEDCEVDVEPCPWWMVVGVERAPTAVAPAARPPASFKKSRRRTAG